MPSLFDPKGRGKKDQPLRRKFEHTPSPLSQVTTPDGIRGNASKRSLAISALMETLQPPKKRKRDRENGLLDSDLSLAPGPSPVVGMVKTRGRERSERKIKRKASTGSSAVRHRKLKRRREKSPKFEMTPTIIEKIENPAQIIMSEFPLCNHPLWKQTPRRGMMGMNEPAPCIPSLLEQLGRQNRECNEEKHDLDAKDNVKPDLNPW